jgi:CBS domain-containing protein
MRIDEIMTRDVIAVAPEAPIHKAARLMVNHSVSGLPVVDGRGKIVGIVSEGDLIVRQKPRERMPWWKLFFAEGEQLARDYQKRAGMTVAEVMTRSVISVGPELSVDAVALVLDKHRVRRVPVVSNGVLVGIVSRGDLIKALATAPPAAGPRSDLQLVAEMRARLGREPWAARYGVVIEAQDGVLSLWGLVDSDAERSALVTMARAIEGCTGVNNHLDLRSEIPYHYGA